jgi:putative nucleotidyltransferase with HDIG domain
VKYAATPLTTLERKLEDLPLLPTVVAEVLSLNPDSEDYFDRLLHLAERDPPFAVRVLRCANSATSAPANPIVSLQQGIARLGTRRCADLVLAVAVIKVFVPRSEAQRLLWIHSLQVAIFARAFCQRLPTILANPDQAYLCGLLHDIGRFVQFEGAPADLTEVNDTHWASPKELVESEQRALGYDHSLLGWSACRKWALPSMIGEVVRRHHEAPSPREGGLDELVRIVQWADRLSMALMLDTQLAKAGDDDLPAALRTRITDIGPAGVTKAPPSWLEWVPKLRAESARLAAELQLFP